MALGVLDKIPESSHYFTNLKNYAKARVLVKMERPLDAVEVLESSHLDQKEDPELQCNIC